MGAAVWAIAYAIDASDRAAYLDWFHGVHIPEKLGRPGYDWAGHYEGGGRFLALFGGADARAFLDPTPGQLKGRQDELSRRMIGMRRGVDAVVAVEATAVGAASRAAPAFVRLAWMDAPDVAATDAAALRAVQEWLPQAARTPGCEWAAFLVPVIGGSTRLLIEAHSAAVPAGVPAAGTRAFEGARIDAR